MKKLLVIDDDERITESVHLVLDKSFQVMDASCKEEAVHAFTSWKPDVILLDIEFHGIPDGWKILQEIRSRDKNVIIFLMSANGSYMEHSLACQADGFFYKPFSPQELKDILRKIGMME